MNARVVPFTVRRPRPTPNSRESLAQTMQRLFPQLSPAMQKAYVALALEALGEAGEDDQ